MCSTHCKIWAYLYVKTYVSTMIRTRNLVIDKSVRVDTAGGAAIFFPPSNFIFLETRFSQINLPITHSFHYITNITQKKLA